MWTRTLNFNIYLVIFLFYKTNVCSLNMKCNSILVLYYVNKSKSSQFSQNILKRIYSLHLLLQHNSIWKCRRHVGSHCLTYSPLAGFRHFHQKCTAIHFMCSQILRINIYMCIYKNIYVYKLTHHHVSKPTLAFSIYGTFFFLCGLMKINEGFRLPIQSL